MPTASSREGLLDDIDARQDDLLERLAELNDSVEKLLAIARSPEAATLRGRATPRAADDGTTARRTRAVDTAAVRRAA